MRANSLAFRLILSSAVIACVLLVAAGLLLGALFQQALERNFDSRLQAVMDGLLANVSLQADGSPSLTDPIADTRFALAESGWYWQVEPPDASDAVPLVSQSLLNMELDVADSLVKPGADGIARFSMRDRKGQQLRVIQQSFKLFGREKPYTFLVAGNFDELSAEVQSFRRVLYAILALLGLGLLGAILFQVRFGLRPMQEMQKKLNDIRSGKIEMLDGQFPAEMQPVANELNLLIESNMEIIDRARMQVGNLAHALKTPISVLTNEARDGSALAEKVREQIDVMRDQVNLYLDRARRAARAQAIGSACEVEPVLQALARTLTRIHRDKGLEISVEAAKGLKFRGERQDLEEMVGNLMDNASKWAQSRVLATLQLEPPGEDGRAWLSIYIDDDGPGIPAEKRAMAMKRGQRLDESKPGSGLGLNIVGETAGMHGGRLELEHAPMGGLRAVLKLPAIM